MTGLSIIVAGLDEARFRTALTLAAAHVALGGRARLLLDGESVRIIGSVEPELVQSCLELGVAITLCQSGLALTGLDAASLDDRFEFGGMVAFLADLGADRLLIA